MKELELYVHIPFCVRKCSYCDFLSFPAEESVKKRYVDSLIKEIEQSQDRGNCVVSSVFFGGGTPSVLPGEQIVRILDALKKKFVFMENAEISVECNPGTVDEKKLTLYYMAGINRLSFGLQSADDGELRSLGRIHTWESFQKSYQMAREAGFKNINVDLMSALPGQTIQSWENTLEKTAALNPEHISAYSLIIEEGTPFYELYGREDEKREKGGSCVFLPSEEEERLMYERTAQILSQYGYHRYEISNYAKEGRQCRHNCGYWQRKMYRGFGLGASSLMDEWRFKNTDDLEEYMKRIECGEECFAEKEQLSIKEQMEEFMFLGLRLTEGIREADFEKYFGRTLQNIYGDILKKLENQRLVKQERGRICLTSYGTDISNYVLSRFLMD